MFEIRVNISAFIASGDISLLKKIPQWQKVKNAKSGDNFSIRRSWTVARLVLILS